MKAKKWPQYYDGRKFSDIPQITLDGIRPLLKQNPNLTRTELFHATQDILSGREFQEVVKFFKP